MLKYDFNIAINKKRVLNIMRKHNLCKLKNQKLKALRTIRAKPKATRINQFWGIDMTKIQTQTGWAYITIVLDWFTKEPLGWHIGRHSKSCDWLEALEMALNTAGIETNKDLDLNLISDNGCQPTSKFFMKGCELLGINQIFTSYNNPKGNAETERFNRTAKEEFLWLREWFDVEEVQKELGIWLKNFKNHYRHSKLNYKTIVEFKRTFIKENQCILAA